MTEYQKKIVLFVFSCLDDVHGKTFFQKLFYIFKREEQILLDLFEYTPYYYGPFSKELNNTVNELIEERYIQEVRSGDYCIYSITDSGLKNVKEMSFISEDKKKAIKQICKHVKNFRPSDLLKYVYRKYPETTINSVLKRKNTNHN